MPEANSECTREPASLAACTAYVSFSSQHHFETGQTLDGLPAAEEDLFRDRLIRWGAELGHHNGQHQILGHLLPLHTVAQLQVWHISKR